MCIHVHVYIYIYIYRERERCIHMCMYIYIYIYTSPCRGRASATSSRTRLEWHYSSNATRLMRPHLFFLRRHLSNTASVSCYIAHHFWRKPALDKYTRSP